MSEEDVRYFEELRAWYKREAPKNLILVQENHRLRGEVQRLKGDNQTLLGMAVELLVGFWQQRRDR